MRAWTSAATWLMQLASRIHGSGEDLVEDIFFWKVIWLRTLLARLKYHSKKGVKFYESCYWRLVNVWFANGNDWVISIKEKLVLKTNWGNFLKAERREFGQSICLVNGIYFSCVYVAFWVLLFHFFPSITFFVASQSVMSFFFCVWSQSLSRKLRNLFGLIMSFLYKYF